MLNLMNRCGLLTLAFTLTACSQAPSTSEPKRADETSSQSTQVKLSPSDCVETTLDVSVARKDERNTRLFIVGSASTADEMKAKSSELANCFKETDWADTYALSLFSDKKYVGYMTDDIVQAFHKNNEWAKNYLAEYSRRKDMLTLTPAIKTDELGHDPAHDK